MASNLALKEEMTEGLGSFALGEADAEAYLAEEVDSGGIADLGAIRERMAKAGRFDDDHVGHLATGELVVPAPLLEKLPELRESILGHLREMGVEDPERYIVGNELNSVNPETGMVEFGFFSSIKKAFKSVGKVLKKVAPLIITAAVAAIPGVGPIAAGMIGSGLGTLVQGGSLKDAIISAGIGGITAGIAPSVGDIGAQALGGMAQSAVAGGDMKDILTGGAIGAAGAGLGKFAKANFPETIGSITGETLDPNASTLSYISEDLGKAGNFASNITSGNVSEAFAPSGKAFNDEFGNVFGTDSGTAAPVSGQTTLVSGGDSPLADRTAFEPTMMDDQGNIYAARNLRTGETLSLNGQKVGPAPSAGQPLTSADVSPGYGGPAPAPQKTTLGQVGDYLADTRVGRFFDDPVQSMTGAEKITGSDIRNNVSTVPKSVLDQYKLELANNPGMEYGDKVAYADALAAQTSPGFIRRNPLLTTVGAAGGLGLLALGMDTEQPETESPGVVPSGFATGPSQEAIAANRMASISGNPDALKPLTFANRQTRVNPAINEDLRRRFPGIFAAADGGEVFPRRTGGIMPDEGVPGKDSVRALVMPGEFIFTTNAVRGASPDGSLEGGINNMYSVMRNLETRGRRMA